jgi:hypothetical protein
MSYAREVMSSQAGSPVVRAYMGVSACMCVRVYACVRACVRVCERARVR